MSKTTQPIGGPPTAPSPGLPQSAFPSAPSAPVVFGPPQTPQMNTQSQPRQAGFRSIQHYYQSRTQPPSTATRVPSGSTARAVPPTHVYPAGSQVMMIPSQLSYTSQGYYIQGQGRSYVMPTQQYPVQPGAPGFFPSASPTEYGTYAGAYYPAQQQFPPGVPGTQVMINQQQAIPPKRERKTIRIRDPNQGGKDVTDEILSGGRTSSTPTPPQSAAGGSEVQANGESIHVPIVVRPDDGSKTTQVLTKLSESPSPSPPAEVNLNMPVVCEQDLTLDNTIPEVSVPLLGTLNSQEVPLLETHSTQVSVLPEAPTDIQEIPNLAEVNILDTSVINPIETVTEAPVIQPQPEPLIPTQTSVSESQETPLPQEEVSCTPPEIDFHTEAAPSQSSSDSCPVDAEEPATESTQEQCPPESVPAVELEATNGLSEETTVPPAQPEPSSVCHSEPSLDSPIAQPEELLINGDGLPDVQEIEAQNTLESHVSPITEPEEKIVDPTPEIQDVQKEPPAEPEPVPSQSAKQTSEVPVAVAVSAPKKRRKLKELNKKEAGDLLDAFKEASDGTNEAAESAANPPAAAPEVDQTPTVPVEEQDETWEEKEDKLDAENIKPGDLKYKYKEEQWKPLNPEEKKSYDREFLLGFQFIVASMQKPEGLPQITDVVLDKANKNPLRPLDPARLTGMNCGPDFTPSFANLGRPAMGNRGPQANLGGARRSQQGPRKEPRKIIAAVSLNENVQLNKAEKAWKPINKRASDEDDPENLKTRELFRRVRSILNKLTPQMFQQLMKQVTDLAIDTEDRLKGVIDLIFEKAISEPNFSVAYANMCRCLMGLKVPTTDKPGVTVNFRKLLLNRCQKEFEKDKDDDEVFEKKQKEMDAASTPEEKSRLNDELVEARDSARRRSLGNIKFIGELFKLKMLTEAIMHDCVVKLLKNHDEESLECLCRLLSTIGKDLDFERAKPRMDQYFNQVDKIIKERKTSSRIRFMLQDVLDLRLCNWIPRRADQGPKTIDQIHKDAEMEKQREQVKVQQLMSKQDNKRREPPGRPTGGRGSQPNDDGWNTVPISKGSRPIDTSRITKITKLGAIDSNQLLAPGGRLSWGKGSSGGTGAKPPESAPESGRPATSTLNRFSALQQSASAESQDARRAVQRGSSSRDRADKDRGDRFERAERFDKGDLFERSGRPDRARAVITKRSFSKETEDHSRERDRQIPQEAVRKVASMTEPRDRSKDSIKLEPPTSVAAPVAASKPALSEEELEKKSKSIIEEYLHINDMKEALQCVQELDSPSLLFIFVRNSIESTLERSTIAREHMGLLLFSLVKTGALTKEQYYKGVLEVLEVAEDMEIDIPHIWLYLAELISPVLTEGGIPMGELFRELTKPLIAIGKAGVLLAEILGLQCKGMSHKKAGALWQESGLSWNEFLSKDEDLNKFISDNKLEYTLGEESETPSKKDISPAELEKMLSKLLKENCSNQKIFDWIEASLTDQQLSSNTFVRTLMGSVCNSAIIFENPCRVDVNVIHTRAKLLQKYFNNETKELQALYALQALVVKLDQPPNLLRMFFDALYDEDVIKEEPFYEWESSKDPSEQQGKGVALKSVTAFFTWLREAEDESDTDHKD
ncbi:eukaryotic translation initiation factor 4 gamma 1 isoform X1 [Ranitomeya variabilis]|uniref:eukaryotic translation initiation factor 4 gamma 1 isoform X1 n=1 Tax=Ranitomeya variabilis TaxID=490064 RepID=UPI0040576EC8